MRLTIEKYHGLGNDYLVYDPNKNKLKLTPARVQFLCNRNFGVGADGVLEGPVLEGSERSNFTAVPAGILPTATQSEMLLTIPPPG